MKRLLIIFFCCLALPQLSFASVKATGTYVATKSCPAYQSLKHKENPGNITLTVGESYEVKSVIKASDWDWVYVLVEGATPKARWIASDCGTGELVVTSTPNNSGNNSASSGCNVANTHDSNVLAVSWQPGFCENKRPNNIECVPMNAGNFDVHYFTLHGLWPNKKGCGITYGKCSGEKASLEPSTIDILDDYMPSLQKGDEWLMNHEWNKHGTCQSLSDDEYFLLSVELVKQFNESPIGKFITGNIPQTIQAADLASHIKDTMGTGMVDRFKLDCENGELIEILISLPRDITVGDTLADTMKGANPLTGGLQGDCGNKFYVEHAGPE